MTNIQHEYLSMFKVVQLYFDENLSEITALLPAFAGQKAIYDSLITAIYMAGAEADQDITGYAVDKYEAREKLVTGMLRISGAALLYYTNVAPDATLAERIRHSSKVISLRTDASLIVNTMVIQQVSEGIKTLLGPYGVSAADVDSLPALLNAFEARRSQPREMRQEAFRQKKIMDTHFAQTKTLLRETIDRMLGLLSSSHSLLFAKYKSARKIRRTGGRRAAGKPYMRRVQPGAVAVLRLSNKISGDQQPIRLSSHTAGSPGRVNIYFSANPTRVPSEGEGIEISSLQTTSLTAGDLGYTEQKPYLCAYNSGHMLHTVGVVLG